MTFFSESEFAMNWLMKLQSFYKIVTATIIRYYQENQMTKSCLVLLFSFVLLFLFCFVLLRYHLLQHPGCNDVLHKLSKEHKEKPERKTDRVQWGLSNFFHPHKLNRTLEPTLYSIITAGNLVLSKSIYQLKS